MAPPLTFTVASPARRPSALVRIASARTGPAASVYPAAAALEAAMNRRRDSGTARVRPAMSDKVLTAGMAISRKLLATEPHTPISLSPRADYQRLDQRLAGRNA